jgi:hypothetical protein
MTIGATYRTIELLYGYARPLGDLVLLAVGKYYETGTEPVPGRGGLWEPQGAGRCDGGLYGRPSLWAGLRRGARRRLARRRRDRVAA